MFQVFRKGKKSPQGRLMPIRCDKQDRINRVVAVRAPYLKMEMRICTAPNWVQPVTRIADEISRRKLPTHRHHWWLMEVTVEGEVAVGVADDRIVRASAKREIVRSYQGAIADGDDLCSARRSEINAEVKTLS